MATMAPRTALGTVSASQANTRMSRMSLGAPGRVNKKEPGRLSLAASAHEAGGETGRRSVGRASVGRASVGRASMGRASVGLGRRQSSSSRMSMGGGLNSSRQSFGGRASLGSRRSSIHGSATGTSDPRPLSDKTYRAQCVRSLIEFLSENGYDAPLSPKLLVAPSTKDFIRIFQFIYGQFDPSYPWDRVKAEDDIPLILKNIGYPFTVKKSAIFACGSQHNWPKLLGALTWMIEAAAFIVNNNPHSVLVRAQDGDFASNDPQEEDTEVIFLEYAENAYAAFLKDESAKDTFVANLRQSFDERNQDEREREIELRGINTRLRAELAELEAKAPPLSTLREKRDTFASDKTKFEELIRNLQAHLTKQQSKLQQNAAERETRAAELDHLQAEKARLKEVQDNQEMTPADVEKINSLQHQLERDLASVAQRKEATEQEAWRLEVAVNKRLEQVEQTAAAFNSMAEQLGLVPGGANNPTQCDCRVTVNGAAETEAGMLKPSLATLRHAIDASVEALSQHVNAVNTEKLDTQEALNNLNEAIRAKQDDLSIMEDKLRGLNDQYRTSQESMSEEYKLLAGNVEEMQGHVSRLKMAAASVQVESERRLEQLKLQYDTVRASLAHEQDGLHHVILEAVNLVVVHKEHIEQKLKHLQTTASKLVE